MKVVRIRRGALVGVRFTKSSRTFKRKGVITGLQYKNRNYLITITGDQGSSKHWHHRVIFIKGPVFKEPYRLYTHKKLCTRTRFNVANGVAPVQLEPGKDYIPTLFEREDVQDIVEMLKDSTYMKWTRSEFLKVLLKIKKIYIGFDVKR